MQKIRRAVYVGKFLIREETIPFWAQKIACLFWGQSKDSKQIEGSRTDPTPKLLLSCIVAVLV